MRRVLLLLALVVLGAVAAAPSAAQVRVRGQVSLPDGSPAVGVDVRLLRQTGSYEFYQLLAEGKHYPEPVDEASTREDGSFELRAPEPGMWQLHVAPRGFRPMEFNFWPLLADRQVPELALIAETAVKVRVTDVDGEPIPGAHVRAKAPESGNRRSFAREFWRPAYRQAITDEKGHARIGRASNEALDVYAYALGLRAAEVTSVQTSSIQLQLTAAASSTLRIETARGEPIGGALVRLGERRWPAGMTGDDGQVQLFLTEQDEPEVHVLAPDGRRLSERLSLAAWPDDGPLALTLEPRQLYAGRLIDAESQNGVAGGFAWISGRPVDFVRSDSTGGFELGLEAGAKKWVWGAATGYLNQAAQVDLRADSGPTLLLQPAVEAHGVVVDSSDQPVGGAKVAASVDLASGGRQRSWQAGAWLTPAVTDARGGFTLSRLDPRVGYTIKAAKPGYAPTELALPDPRAEARSGVRLVLEAGRMVVGSVVDQGGLPVVGAQVDLTESLSSSNPRRFFMQRALDNLEPEEAFTDEEGRFVIWDLPAGLFDLKASASGYAPTELATIELARSATEIDVGEIALEPGFAIEGRVTSVDGAALEGAQVFASARAEFSRVYVSGYDDGEAPVAITDVNGFFSVVDRAEGEKVDLVARMSGYAEGKVAAVSVPTYRPVSIQLEKASRVRGEVVDENGRAVAEAQVASHVTVATAMSSSTRSGSSAITNSDGSFLLESVDPGELELSIRAEGFVAAMIGSLRVEPGEDLEGVRAVLKRGATISGRITGPGGRPVPHAQVLSMERGPGFGRAYHGGAAADGEGRYRIEGIPPGTRSVVVQHDDYKQETRTLEVEVGDNVLDIVLERGLTLSGRVLDSSGQPVATADLNLNSNSISLMGNPQDVSDNSGDFSIGGLSEGTYTLQAHKEGFAAVTLENLEVGPAGLSGVEVRLEPGLTVVGRLIGLEPADYANVQVYAVKAPSGFTPGRVNRDGTYRLDSLAPGQYTVQAQVETTGLRADGQVTVVTGVRETVFDLEFEVGLMLTGVVLKSAEPVGGAQISVSGVDVATSSGGMTDSEGRFRVQGLDPGHYQLAVSNHINTLNHLEEIEIRVDRDITIRIEVAEVSGFVRDAADSQPLSGASVQLEPLDTQIMLQNYGYHASIKADSDGYFKFREASIGSYRVLAEKEGYAPGSTSLTVVDGSIHEDIEILLDRTEGIRVYVTLPGGQPAENFFATVFDTAGNRVTSGMYASDSDGAATLSLAPGTWDLLVGTSDTAVSEARVDVPSAPVAIALQPEARLQILVPELVDDPALGTVKVFDSSGQPYKTMFWMQTREEWPMAKGRATVTGLSPGTWSLQVTTPDGRSWQGQVQLAPGDNPEVVL